ncbi:MAG: hypothetical protein GXP29_04700 [Planctomycetes bacterium]|nr:hypothetical protein [Planctomycetota bacterium]
MMTSFVCALTLGLATPVDVTISAKINADCSATGDPCSIELRYDVSTGASLTTAGLATPLIQIEIPDSVQLVGKVLDSHKELSKNEFLHAPFELAMDSNPATIEFKIIGEPKTSDRIAINFIAYAKGKADENTFIRKRIAIPVKAGGIGAEVAVGDGGWGKNGFLKIGDKVEAIELPRADGSVLKFSDHLGKSNVVITTYRAHW